MRNFYCNFTYNQLIIAGAHLGGKQNINENYNIFGVLSYNNIVCLDIKQAKKELAKAINLVQHIGRLRGHFLLMTGGLLSQTLLTKLFCGTPYLIIFTRRLFGGYFSNEVTNKYGIPTLAFSSNIDRCWYLSFECHRGALPLISLVDYKMRQPLASQLTSYKILSNDDNESTRLIYVCLMKHAFILGLMKSHIYLSRIKHIFIDIKKTTNKIFKNIKNKIPVVYYYTKQKLESYDYLLIKDEISDTIDFLKSFFFYYLTEDNIKLIKRFYFDKTNISHNRELNSYNEKYYNIFHYMSLILDDFKDLAKEDLIYLFYILKNCKTNNKYSLNYFDLNKSIFNKNIFISENMFTNKYNNSLLLDLNQYFQKKNRF